MGICGDASQVYAERGVWYFLLLTDTKADSVGTLSSQETLLTLCGLFFSVLALLFFSETTVSITITSLKKKKKTTKKPGIVHLIQPTDIIIDNRFDFGSGLGSE